MQYSDNQWIVLMIKIGLIKNVPLAQRILQNRLKKNQIICCKS